MRASTSYRQRAARAGLARVGIATLILSSFSLAQPSRATSVPTAPPSIMFGDRVKPRATDPVFTADPGRNAVLYKESQLGRKLALDHAFYHFDDPWPTAREIWDQAGGRTPFINWSPEEPNLTWAQVAAGQADSIIDARAAGAKAFSSTIYLTFNHEPEDDTTTRGTSAEYRAAWKHVRARFDAAGVTNIKYVLVLTSWTYTQGTADQWYPGPNVVDFVGADGYNWYPGKAGSKWRDMKAIFTPFYNWSLAKGKPAIIAETGCQEDPANPTRKATWFANATTWLKTVPNVKAVIYFDSDLSYPWWTDSSVASLAAYKAMGSDPAFALTAL